MICLSYLLQCTLWYFILKSFWELVVLRLEYSFLTARIVDVYWRRDGKNTRYYATKTRRKISRFWIKAVSPFVCLSAFLLFVHIVKDFPAPIKIAYIFVTYIFWGSICYTGINIPYGSMASVISEKSEDRASLSVFRTLEQMFLYCLYRW